MWMDNSFPFEGRIGDREKRTIKICNLFLEGGGLFSFHVSTQIVCSVSSVAAPPFVPPSVAAFFGCQCTFYVSTMSICWWCQRWCTLTRMQGEFSRQHYSETRVPDYRSTTLGCIGVPRIIKWRGLEGTDPEIFQQGGRPRLTGGGSPPVGSSGPEAEAEC